MKTGNEPQLSKYLVQRWKNLKEEKIPTAHRTLVIVFNRAIFGRISRA
jgi:hypothetical protein